MLPILFITTSNSCFAPVYASDVVVPDDVLSINSAISMAPNSRTKDKTVRIKRGTYAEIAYINKSITLLGGDRPTIIAPLTANQHKK